MTKPRELKYRDGKLIFEDYGKRELRILEDKYLQLMEDPERVQHRSSLEECLLSPTEVWIDQLEIKGEVITLYKYFKFYSNGTFLVFAVVDEFLNLNLNNFLFLAESRASEIEQLRQGRLIISPDWE